MRPVRKHRRSGNDGSFWLSFSDLMSSLVLIIILVMFYIIYLYFNEAETNARIIAAREAELDATQAQLTSAQADLTTAQKELAVQQGLLATRESELATAQTELDAATKALGERETQLATQQTQLDTLSAQLDTKQSEIDAKQALLDSQQSELDDARAQLAAQEKQIEQLVGLRTRIVTDISDAFKANNINASVDPSNGSIALESDVLFTSGESVLAPSGLRFLDDILPIYLAVLFSDEYRPYVTEIIVEGHTDSDGTWLNNLELSQKRAFAVISYVMDGCVSISPQMKNELRDIVTVNGRSYSERIFNPDGSENKDSSRRVVFKFRLTDEQMITRLQQILEDEGVN